MTTPEFGHSGRKGASLDRRSLMLAVAGGMVASVLTSRPGIGSAQSGPSALSATMDHALADGVEQGVPGIALAIGHKGERIYSGAAGVSSLEEGTPMRADDRFRIYSITKTFTATIVFQLVDEGMISLDDTVLRWLDDPDVARIPHIEQVTIRQVLNHTSGVYDFGDDSDSTFWDDAFLGPDADWTRVWTLPELLAYADPANHAPYFAPGEGVHYSNTNYLLLGMIVEKATGSTFAEQLHTRILTPLGLHDTFLAVGGTMPDGVVDGYQVVEDQLVNVSAINLSWVWSAGGMISTTADLLRFASAVMSGELLSTASFEQMFTFVEVDHSGLAFGSGLYRAGTPNGTLVGMDGGSAGFSANMMWRADEGVAVVVLINCAPDQGTGEGVRDEAFSQDLSR